MEKIQGIADELNTLKEEEEEYCDNMPENLQSSERYVKSDESVSYLDDAVQSLENAVDAIENSMK